MCYHDELREDFKFLYAALQKHPAILTDEQIKSCFARLYQAKAGEVSTQILKCLIRKKIIVFLCHAIGMKTAANWFLTGNTKKYRLMHKLWGLTV